MAARTCGGTNGGTPFGVFRSDPGIQRRFLDGAHQEHVAKQDEAGPDRSTLPRMSTMLRISQVRVLRKPPEHVNKATTKGSALKRTKSE